MKDLKISSIELRQELDGFKPFKFSLKDLVILTGSNGAGKTRLLKRIQCYVQSLEQGKYNEETDGRFDLFIQDAKGIDRLTPSNANRLRIINYSHYDARLQLPNDFSPYVIHKAKEILKKCDYEETALNSLLLMEDMAQGYSEEFRDGQCFQRFKTDVEENFDIQINYDIEKSKLQLFGRDLEAMELSPGQQYLLRMAVACFQNENRDDFVFFLDEPELHLHPKALIKLLKKLREKFPTAQFWISTHSLALVSFFSVMEDATLLYLQKGKLKGFRSDSSELLDGLLGTEENRFAIQQLLMLPEIYASNKFAFECFDAPTVVSGGTGKDPQVEMVRTNLMSGDMLLDYGAGRGRFLEELALGNAKTKDGNDAIGSIQYYAFNEQQYERKEDVQTCKMIMHQHSYTPDEYYFNDFKVLQNKFLKAFDYILLINVLHEIPPNEWKKLFGEIMSLLKVSGKVILVEREELTIGEAPYQQKFLMITSNAITKMFGPEHVKVERHPEREYLVKYTIDYDGLDMKTIEDMDLVLKIIIQDALDKIEQIKNSPISDNRKNRFLQGIRLSFWLHEYANATILLRENQKTKH